MAGGPGKTTSVAKGLGGWAFLIAMAGCYGVAGLYYPGVAKTALSSLSALLIRVIPVLVVVFAFLFLAELFIDRKWLARNLSGASGIRGWAIAVASGVLSAGPLYAWYPLLGELREKGMSNALIAAFLYSRALKLPLLPLMVHYFGAGYTIVLSICIVLFSVVSGLLMQKLDPLTAPDRRAGVFQLPLKEKPMPNAIDYEAALLDPAAVFSGPEDVLYEAKLTKEQKIEILRRWEYDAVEVAVAEEEGMQGERPLILRRVLLALEKLTGGVEAEHPPPTKHDGI